MGLSVLIIEDEQPSRLLLRFLLQNYFPEVNQILEAESASIARSLLKDRYFDLLLADIHIGPENIFSLLDEYPELQTPLIFITADQSFAIRAFKYSALDYLIKPVDDAEFRTAVARSLQKSFIGRELLRQQWEIFRSAIQAPFQIPDRISVSSSDGIYIVRVSELMYCRAEGNYVRFFLIGGRKFLSSHHLGYFTTTLEQCGLVKVHRTYVINPGFVQIYKKGDGGSLIMMDGEEIDVSRSLKQTVQKMFGGF